MSPVGVGAGAGAGFSAGFSAGCVCGGGCGGCCGGGAGCGAFCAAATLTSVAITIAPTRVLSFMGRLRSVPERKEQGQTSGDLRVVDQEVLVEQLLAERVVARVDAERDGSPGE